MKILEVNEPLLSTYPEYGSVFSIIPDNELSDNWMYSNFIQYFVKKNKLFVSGEELLVYKDHVNFISTVPTLQNYKVCEEILNELNDASLLDELIKFIEMGFYIILLLDRFYISKSNNYRKRPLVHLTLIYGYDEKEGVFYVADNNKYGKYDFMKYKFEEVVDAFRAMQYNDFRDTKTINLVRPFEHIHYGFDIKYLIRELEFYLESYDLRDTHLKNWNPYNPLNYGHNKENIEYYNLGVYDYLKKILKHCVDYIELQPFHLLYEHKRFMVLRLEFLYKRRYVKLNYENLKIECENLKNSAQDLLNCAIKFNVSKRETLLSTMCLNIDLIKQNEIKTIKNIIEGIS